MLAGCKCSSDIYESMLQMVKYHGRYRLLNFDPIGILTAKVMPVTLLLIKLEKQAIYHWKVNKHAHITVIKLKQ